MRLGIVSGRRRQGKTYLLDAVASAVDGFFYTATEDTEADALASFGRALAEALDRLFTAVTGRLVVIDEFPYLSKANPSLPSLLQRALEPRGIARRSRSRLLLCGSAMSVMGRGAGFNDGLRAEAHRDLVGLDTLYA